ncbi:hypothetical protein M758_5G088800 [Ceratodon purpureus]|nr:hypothetical protein M758_5G088800 [Ceratodon purpureus]
MENMASRPQGVAFAKQRGTMIILSASQKREGSRSEGSRYSPSTPTSYAMCRDEWSSEVL